MPQRPHEFDKTKGYMKSLDDEDKYRASVEAWKDAGQKENDPGFITVVGKVLEKDFYGHYLPSHFKKSSIISTTGRV